MIITRNSFGCRCGHANVTQITGAIAQESLVKSFGAQQQQQEEQQKKPPWNCCKHCTTTSFYWIVFVILNIVFKYQKLFCISYFISYFFIILELVLAMLQLLTFVVCTFTRPKNVFKQCSVVHSSPRLGNIRKTLGIVPFVAARICNSNTHFSIVVQQILFNTIS